MSHWCTLANCNCIQYTRNIGWLNTHNKETEYKHVIRQYNNQLTYRTVISKDTTLKTKDHPVRISVTGNLDGDCTNVAAPLLWADLEVLRSLVERDDPVVFEARIMDRIIEKPRRGNLRFEDFSLLHACDRVDSKPSCEFHLETTTSTSGSIRSNSWNNGVYWKLTQRPST